MSCRDAQLYGGTLSKGATNVAPPMDSIKLSSRAGRLVQIYEYLPLLYISNISYNVWMDADTHEHANTLVHISGFPEFHFLRRGKIWLGSVHQR